MLGRQLGNSGALCRQTLSTTQCEIKKFHNVDQAIAAAKSTDVLAIENCSVNASDLTEIETLIKEIKSIKTVILNNCGLNVVPECLKFAESLTSLELNQNNISDIPLFLFSNQKLKTLSLNQNQITEIPNEIFSSKILRCSLESNKITSLPSVALSKKPIYINIKDNYIPLSTIQESEYSKAQRIYTNLIYQKVPDKVIDGLYISSLTPTAENEILKKFKITTILSLGTKPENEFEGIHYHFFDIPDVSSADIKSVFSETNKLIDDTLKDGKCVLVHCAAGQSRSSTIVIAFLMKEHKFSFEQAYAFLKKARFCAKPNDGFIESLKSYETECAF